MVIQLSFIVIQLFIVYCSLRNTNCTNLRIKYCFIVLLFHCFIVSLLLSYFNIFLLISSYFCFYCSLFYVHCSLPTADCGLLTVYCSKMFIVLRLLLIWSYIVIHGHTLSFMVIHCHS